MAANYSRLNRYNYKEEEQDADLVGNGLINQPAQPAPTQPAPVAQPTGMIAGQQTPTGQTPTGQEQPTALTPYQIAGLRQKEAMGYDLTDAEKAAITAATQPAPTTPTTPTAPTQPTAPADWQRPSILTSNYKDIIYGQTFGSGWGKGLNLDEWDGQKLSTAEGKVRDGWATGNVQITKDILRKLYPNATQEQLDYAAYQAFQNTANTTKDEGGDRDASKWGKNGTFDTVKKFGYGYSEDILPTDLVRKIAQYMPGGLNEKQAEALKTLDQPLADRARKLTKNRDKEDDANSGLSAIVNKLGPIGMMAISMIPGVGQAAALAMNVGAAAEDGNWKGVATNLLTYGAGQYIKGLEGVQNPAAGSLASFAQTKLPLGLTGANLMSAGASGLINQNPQAALTSLVGASVGNQVGAATQSDLVGQIARGGVGLAASLYGMNNRPAPRRRTRTGG